MKLLVTGGTGFVGSHLAESALKQGYEVNVLGLTESAADKANAESLLSLGANIFAGSITDAALCHDALDGVTHVYHLAVAMRESGATDDYFKQVNLDGTKAIIDESKRCDVQRFVYCGTIGIFGHRFAGVCNEDSPIRPGNIYEETKFAAEKLALEYANEIGLDTVGLRPADIYGPRDQRLRKLFMAVSKGHFPLFGSGSGRRHMVYISDVVSAFENVLCNDAAIGKPFIIAGPEVCTLAELVEKIRVASGRRHFGYRLPLKPMLYAAAITEDVCKAIGAPPPIYRRRMDFYTSDSAFETTRAKTVLGWQARVTLDDGVAQTLDHYLNDS